LCVTTNRGSERRRPYAHGCNRTFGLTSTSHGSGE
jgi:hypothetical protein